MIYKELFAYKKRLLRQYNILFFLIGSGSERSAESIENNHKIVTSKIPCFVLASGLLFGIVGVFFLCLSFFVLSAREAEACQMVCGQVNAVGSAGNPSLDTGGNCKYDFDGGGTYLACIVSIGSAGGLVNPNSRCADDASINACDTAQCPFNLHVGDGANCAIMSSQMIGVCTFVPLSTGGKWDASEGKCVKCSGQMEDRVYNISGNTFTDTDVANKCESACGGPASRDELANCIVPSCVINIPTIVSISPASFTGPIGGSKVYTITARNNNTDCGSYSINFTASLHSDLTASWVIGGSTGPVAEGMTGTATITINAKVTATPGTKSFTITGFPHDNVAATDYPLSSMTSTASYIIPALPVEICNDPGIADEDGNGFANCADAAACPDGAACEGGNQCQAGACVVVASLPCSGSAMFTSPLGTSCSIRQIFAVAIKWILALAGAILLLVIIIGGLRYITSTGDEEKLRTSKRMLLYAIIGFAIILIAYELITDVANVL